MFLFSSFVSNLHVLLVCVPAVNGCGIVCILSLCFYLIRRRQGKLFICRRFGCRRFDHRSIAARCFASASYAVMQCLSVSLSVRPCVCRVREFCQNE